MPRPSASLVLVLIACAHASACGGGPTLKLLARSSLRTQGGAARAQLWSAGAELGWSTPRGADATRDSAATPPEPDAPLPEPGAACAFETTCDWEARQRGSALARAGRFESEEP